VARRCWYLKAGENGRLARAFEASSTVAFPGDDARLGRFRDDMHFGDLVVTVDVPSRQLIVGEITGDLERRTDDAGQHHSVRTVEWYGRYGQNDRSILSEPMARLLVDANALVELSPVDAWLKFADGVRERPRLAPAPPQAGRPPAAPKARAPRSSTPKAPPAPRPLPPVTHVLCANCGMQKLKAQFRAGSPHCIDCRERLGED
jgi:hypothetical protein